MQRATPSVSYPTGREPSGGGSANERWQAVLARDGSQDGRFVFAVRTTGIYCRPSCPARRPRRDHVLFFDHAAAAEQGGFRACRRCRPGAPSLPAAGVDLVARVCRFIDAHLDHRLTLAVLAHHAALSPAHLHRRFVAAMGITPRQYIAGRRVDRFKAQLRDGRPVTVALYAAGYDSSHGLYGRGQAALGMTPSTYRRGGAGLRIAYTVAACPFGCVLVAATERGICAVMLGDAEPALDHNLAAEFPAAAIRRDDGRLQPWLDPVLRYLEGSQPLPALPVDVRATAFQCRVWLALGAIPSGETRSYRDIAEAIGQPAAVRAVARACATNPTALVVPCHRVVRADGDISGYRWGVERKRALLALEAHAKV